MKAKFIFIHAASVITKSTVFYTVMIGHSQQDQRDLRFFQSLTFNTDYYFRKFSTDVHNFLMRINDNLFPGSTKMMLSLSSVTPAELRSMVLSGRFSLAPLPAGYTYFRSQLDKKPYENK